MIRAPWILSGAAVLMATSLVGGEQARDEPGEIVQVAGHGLYVQVVGPAGAPALLYLHGGPGMGSYDFGVAQSERLSRRLGLILMDQRGALRSDALAEDEPFGLHDLIADIEALREHLGIERWSVLGHSFGGYLAVRYALEHPVAVEALILESPTLDMESSARSVLRGAAAEYRRAGREAEAARCREAADAEMAPREAWEAFSELTRGLGPARNNLYFHGRNKELFDHLIVASGIPGESWGKHQLFQKKLYGEGEVFESLLPRLGEIEPRTFLLKGRYDFVVAQDQLAAFRRALPNAKIVEFERSSHFPHHEEAELFAKVVLDFLGTGEAGAATER